MKGEHPAMVHSLFDEYQNEDRLRQSLTGSVTQKYLIFRRGGALAGFPDF
jgi:hypothetical protein